MGFRDEKGRLVKGHPGLKPKGAKNRETLLKEERRAIFDERISQVFEEKIDAARPEYVLDQFLGKPVETHVNVNVDATPRAKELADKLIRLHG